MNQMNSITKEMEEDIRKSITEGLFKTDSDVEEYAEERNLNVRDLEEMIWVIISEDTPCYGCRYVTMMGTGLYPCNSCSRNVRIKDLYEGSDEKKEN